MPITEESKWYGLFKKDIQVDRFIFEDNVFNVENQSLLQEIIKIAERENSTNFAVLASLVGDGSKRYHVWAAIIWWEGAATLYDNSLQIDKMLISKHVPQSDVCKVESMLFDKQGEIYRDYLP